jgi:hypothetical protein
MKKFKSKLRCQPKEFNLARKQKRTSESVSVVGNQF